MENFVRCSALVSSWQQMKLEVGGAWAHPYKTIAIFIVHSINSRYQTSVSRLILAVKFRINPVLVLRKIMNVEYQLTQGSRSQRQCNF